MPNESTATWWGRREDYRDAREVVVQPCTGQVTNSWEAPWFPPSEASGRSLPGGTVSASQTASSYKTLSRDTDSEPASRSKNKMAHVSEANAQK